MNIIKIQLNHTENITQKELSTAFYAEIGEEYDLSEEEVEEFFTVESQFLLPNSTFITIFLLDFPELELRDQNAQDIVKSYLDTLNQRNSILSITKTNDFALFERVQKYYKEIIELEMEIRNVLTYIMTYDKREIDEELFNIFKVPTVESFDTAKVDEQYENRFFYILFSQYSDFLETKQLNDKKVIAFLKDPSIQSFESFRERVIPRGISEERHINFLSSISTQIKIIEKMRNAIMHVRHFSNRLVQSYEKATDSQDDTSIMKLINEFWEQEREILKPRTWLALAKSQIEITISSVNHGDNETAFHINDSCSDLGLEEKYTEIDLFKADLIPYLFEYVEVKDFDPETPDFEESLSKMVDSILQEMVEALVDEQQQVEFEQPSAN